MHFLDTNECFGGGNSDIFENFRPKMQTIVKNCPYIKGENPPPLFRGAGNRTLRPSHSIEGVSTTFQGRTFSLSETTEGGRVAGF